MRELDQVSRHDTRSTSWGSFLTSQAPVSSPGHVSGVFDGHGAVMVDVLTGAGGGGGGGGGGHPVWQESATNQTGIQEGSPGRVWLYRFQPL